MIKRDLKREFVMPLKANRKVALSTEQKMSGQYVVVNTLELPVETTSEIWLEEVGFPLLLTKQVFINEDGSQGILYTGQAWKPIAPILENQLVHSLFLEAALTVGEEPDGD